MFRHPLFGLEQNVRQNVNFSREYCYIHTKTLPKKKAQVELINSMYTESEAATEPQTPEVWGHCVTHSAPMWIEGVTAMPQWPPTAPACPCPERGGRAPWEGGGAAEGCQGQREAGGALHAQSPGGDGGAFREASYSPTAPAAATAHPATAAAAAEPGCPAEPHLVGEAFHCFQAPRGNRTSGLNSIILHANAMVGGKGRGPIRNEPFQHHTAAIVKEHPQGQKLKLQSEILL